jgi:hypothetical protein
MIISHYPGCCTAAIIHHLCLGVAVEVQEDFDYGAHDLGIIDIVYNYNTGRRAETPSTWEAFAVDLKRVLKGLKQRGFGYATATTTSLQHDVNKVLEEMGWYATPWGKKTRHTESELCVWSFKLDELEN